VADFNHGVDEVSVRCSPRMVTAHGGEERLSNPVAYPLDQILMMYFLSRQRGMVVHGAGVVRSGRGIVLAGPSGAGKSTISRLLAPGAGIEVCSDDRMVVRRRDGFWAFGTPWPGEEEAALNRGYPLEGLYFLRHGERHSRRDLTPAAALERLLPVVSNPWFDRDASERILEVCDDLLTGVPSFVLDFTPDEGVRRHLEEIGAL
jgi:hypothetical protein